MGRKKRFKVKEHQLYTVLPKVWKELKRENRIDKLYRFRARRIEFLSRLFASGFFIQRVLYSKRIRKISLEEHPPVFILGLWRTGTTHLHYLMARDSQFGYLKNHQGQFLKNPPSRSFLLPTSAATQRRTISVTGSLNRLSRHCPKHPNY